MAPTIPDPSRVLLCVPTPLERDRMTQIAPDVFDPGRWLAVETIGFGPVAAAARTSALVAEHRPDGLVLVGIAGGYPGGPAVGTATAFGAAAIDGIGAGEGASLLLPSKMGLPQWIGDGDPIDERLALAGDGPLLLTGCAAAEGPAMLAARRARFPDALAEDMEAFGVALAAHLAGLPLHVVRGISNAAGDRDHAHWKLDEALEAAAAILRQSIGGAPR